MLSSHTYNEKYRKAKFDKAKAHIFVPLIEL